MEYCSSCLRPVNGWLVCPGCGAYAPSIAPPAHPDHSTAVTATATSDGYRPEEFSSPAGYSGALPPEAAPVGTGVLGLAPSLGDSSGDGSGADSTSGAGYEARRWQGRAARRRQVAHWKKHRRRAAAATAVALIGGGLTVAAVQNASTTGSPTAGSTPESLIPTADGPTTAVPSNPVAWQTSTHASTTPSAQPATPRAVRSTVTTNPQPDAATRTRVTSVSSPSPSTTPSATYGTHAPSYTPTTMTSHTSAPASATSSAPATSTPSPTPTTSSPTPLCLLILCVG